MSLQNKNWLYEHKIQVLQQNNNELKTTIGLLKQANDTLEGELIKLNMLEQENTRLGFQKMQLSDQLQAQRRIKEEMQTRKDAEIRQLKQELSQKDHFIERLKIQHEKRMFRANDDLRKSQIQQRQQQAQLDQHLSKSIAVHQNIFDNLKPNEQNSFDDRTNRMSHTNIYKIDRSYIERSHMERSYMERSNVERTASKMNKNGRLSEWKNQKSCTGMGGSKIRQSGSSYKNYTKEELRNAIKALNRAGKTLKDGSFQTSQMRKSHSFLKKNGL